MVNYSVIAYRNKTGNIILLSMGERNGMTKILPTIRCVIPEAAIISMDETDFLNCQNDIEDLNKFLSDKI